MSTKLTLTIEKEIIDQAKKYAQFKGRSLSDLVESYFKYLTQSKESQKADLSPKTKKLKGIIKVEPDFDYKKVLDEKRTAKHDS